MTSAGSGHSLDREAATGARDVHGHAVALAEASRALSQGMRHRHRPDQTRVAGLELLVADQVRHGVRAQRLGAERSRVRCASGEGVAIGRCVGAARS